MWPAKPEASPPETSSSNAPQPVAEEAASTASSSQFPTPRVNGLSLSHRRSASESLSGDGKIKTRPALWTPTPPPNPSKVDSPSSAHSDSPFNQLSPDATDRVFPIRSVVSVNPDVTNRARADTASDNANAASSSSTRFSSRERSVPNSPTAAQAPPSRPVEDTPSRPPYIRQMSELLTQSNDTITPVTANRLDPLFSHSSAGPSSVRSASTTSASGGGPVSPLPPPPNRTNTGFDQDFGGGVLTARFKHVTTKDGHAVITGRDGETIQRCEDEPIHIPGAVQGFGALVVLREEEGGKLVVRIASENTAKIIGYTPKELFALESFCEILSEEHEENLMDQIDFIRDEDADPATNGPEVFTISIRPPGKRSVKLWCAIHTHKMNPDLIICEFEMEDDPHCPLFPPGDTPGATPDLPEDTLNSQPTADEFLESTTAASKPLRVLRGARKKRGEAAAMEVFSIMSQIQEQLAAAPNLDAFLKILVGVVKELTGFHRVMVYQFDHNWNGRVVTELVDPRATKDLYKGLNFPASDIPKQARDLYKINKVRLLYDRDQVTARLVCRTVEDLETPLDMTYSFLRAMSPIHIKYLANMAVRASMSISINAFDELWGLIACHSYGPRGMRVAFPIRKMCRMVGDSASRNIERLSYASRLQARKLINTIPTERNPSGYIVASSEDLLALFDADFGILSIRDETKILGKLEQSHEALAMLEYLRMRKITSVTMSQGLTEDFPDLHYDPGFKLIAGFLLVPLTVSGSDFIVFFRKGQLREVKWAGNPYEKFVKEGTEGYLEPRKSFRTWTEQVVGKCREWTEEQIDTAAVLCLVYGKFIEVWRRKEEALQNSQFTRLLLANSAHEVRTPLNAIINYLEIALEGSLDSETRDNLARSHSASKSLIYVINDLLDLTKLEEGHDLVKGEIFDLPATANEASEMFKGDAKRKQLDYAIIQHPGVPHMVIGDQRRVRQAISNLTANAIQHTSTGGVKIELWLVSSEGDQVEVDVSVEDTGVGMSQTRLDAIFTELEEVQTETDVLGDSEAVEDSRRIESGKAGKRALGLGLAVVARIVQNMNGQLRLKSEEGKGSRFVIRLPFTLAPEDPSASTSDVKLLQTIEGPTTPEAQEGEMMLVDALSLKSPAPSGERVVPMQQDRSLARTASLESISSVGSKMSKKSGKSGKSEVDMLIDAIQEPLGGTRGASRPSSVLSGGVRSVTSVSPTRGIRDQMDDPNSPLERPGQFDRKSSYSNEISPFASENGKIIRPKKAGQEEVTDSAVPLKPVRVPDEELTPSSEKVSARTRVLFDIPGRSSVVEQQPQEPEGASHLQVLVAEDDPINSKIVKKRLEKVGHVVHLTINGEECASAYGDKPGFFDAVLMDMQMPIVDGLTSTKMIRAHEKANPFHDLSKRASRNGRVPIFAVSASLVERERNTYVEAGFDGWILKPVDFKRLNNLLCGMTDDSLRQSCVYKSGEWDKGGWFCKAPKRCDNGVAEGSSSTTNAKQMPAIDTNGEEPKTSTAT